MSLFFQLKPEVQNFFVPHMEIAGGNVLFPYTDKNQTTDHEHWGKSGIRIPVCEAIWLAVDSLPLSVTHLFIGHSASDVLCFCHYYPEWLAPTGSVAFAALGLLPSKGQIVHLKSLFPDAKIHTVFDTGISGRVTDCKVAIWKSGRDVRFTLIRDQIEFFCNRKSYSIPSAIFSLNRFEKLSGIRSGIKTHKPKAPFETFYQSFTSRG